MVINEKDRKVNSMKKNGILIGLTTFLISSLIKDFYYYVMRKSIDAINYQDKVFLIISSIINISVFFYIMIEVIKKRRKP